MTDRMKILIRELEAGVSAHIAHVLRLMCQVLDTEEDEDLTDDHAYVATAVIDQLLPLASSAQTEAKCRELA